MLLTYSINTWHGGWVFSFRNSTAMTVQVKRSRKLDRMYPGLHVSGSALQSEKLWSIRDPAVDILPKVVLFLSLMTQSALFQSRTRTNGRNGDEGKQGKQLPELQDIKTLV